jgi:hypothetical protein
MCPFNGSGGFTRVMNWAADAAAGTKILATRHDQEDDNLASGLSNTICKDGQSSPTADIPFNAKKITGLADPINNQDAVTKNYMLGAAATQGLFTKVGFASADMSLLGRAAGSPAGTLQRIAYNDKADGTGNDVFVVNDDGTVSSRAADGTYKQFTPMTAEARNRIVNGAMQISQENGNTSQGPVTAISWYAADQWITSSSTSPGTATAVRAQAITPNGSKDRYRIIIGTAKAALAAGDFLTVHSHVEGIRLADFKWGSAAARQAMLRFGWKSPAGTYSVALHNGVSANRSYIANFTIAAGQANTDTEQVLVIPGDVTGTWATDAAAGITIRFGIAVGSTYQGVAGWQAGFVFGTSATTNGMATAGNVFELYDVGLYLDANSTGLAPPWQMPDEAQELAACMRYWQTVYHNQTAFSTTAGTQYALSVPFLTTMRVTPAVATFLAGSATGGATGSLGAATTASGVLSMTTASAGVTFSINGRYYAVNARM